MDQIVRWHVFPDREALAREVSRLVVEGAQVAIGARGEFRIVLAGGDTPRGVYAQLAKQAAQWNRWQVYFGDERCLPRNDPARNDTMAREAWLGRAAVPEENLHTIPAEAGADEGARRYAMQLQRVGEFDLVLLGLGEDGHTASLFPGHEIGDDANAPEVLAIHGAPRVPAERVSLSAARLARARQVFFLVTGAGKRQAVSSWQSGDALPAGRIRPASGVDVFLDSAALP